MLPVTWLGVQAQWQNNTTAKIRWQVTNQINVKDYTVQHSVDGIRFTNEYIVAASANTNYFCSLTASNTSNNYYRIQQQDVDGNINYSSIVILKSPTYPVFYYPNPAKDKLFISGVNNYTIANIIDASGKIIVHSILNSTTNYIDVSLLTKGIYFIQLTTNKEIKTLKFIKE